MASPPKTDPQVMLEWWIEGRQGDEQEALYALEDNREVAGSRSSLSPGGMAAHVCRTLGIAEQTFYRWRREYGGLKVEQAKRLKLLEQALLIPCCERLREVFYVQRQVEGYKNEVKSILIKRGSEWHKTEYMQPTHRHNRAGVSGIPHGPAHQGGPNAASRGATERATTGCTRRALLT